MTEDLGPKVGSSGPDNATIMFVGEAPGEKEIIYGKPFVGQAGDVFRKFLMLSGISPDECRLTNVCKYKPPRNDIAKWFSKEGEPHPQVAEGIAELAEEIRSVRPNVIVALGNYPAWVLTGQTRWNKNYASMSGIHDVRGSMYPCTLVEGFKVIPTFHPSFIAREGMTYHGTWMADLDRIKREAKTRQLIYPKRELILDPRSPEDRQECIDYLLSDLSRTLTVDIEYIGSRLLCVGMAVDTDRVYTIATKTPKDVADVRMILTSGIPLCAQNAAFEASILEWHYQMPIMQYIKYDTMLAQHATNPELPKALDYLASVYTDQPYYKGMVDWKQVATGKQPVEEVYEYNAIDVWVTHKVMEEQIHHDLDDPKVLETFQHEMALLAPLWEMSKRGVRINTPALEALRGTLAEEFTEMQARLNELAGKRVNVKSLVDMRWLLFTHLKMKAGRKTSTGAATDDKTLSMLLGKASDEQASVITLVRDIRQRRDLLSKFLEVGFDDDGRARGQYNPAGTVTGRLSSSKFYPTGNGGNQQNVPRDKRIRSLYIPDTGYEFGYSDLERAESLVVAYLTNDPRMLADHAPGTDAHSSLAAVLFDKPQSEITTDERYLGKQTRHAGNYMEGPKIFQGSVNKIAHKTGVFLEYSEAKRLIMLYREVHPFLTNWWKRVEQELWDTRTLYNLLGRRRIFYGHVRSLLPEAVAYVPQSTVGDVLNVALLNTQGVRSPYIKEEERWEAIREDAARLRGYGFQLLLQVHDAIGYQYELRYRDEVCATLDRLMRVPLVAPATYEEFTIPVEHAVGPSWGEVTKWKGE